jgi:hypothetical protein
MLRKEIEFVSASLFNIYQVRTKKMKQQISHAHGQAVAARTAQEASVLRAASARLAQGSTTSGRDGPSQISVHGRAIEGEKGSTGQVDSGQVYLYVVVSIRSTSLRCVATEAWRDVRKDRSQAKDQIPRRVAARGRREDRCPQDAFVRMHGGRLVDCVERALASRYKAGRM